MSLNDFLNNYNQTLSAHQISNKDYNTIDQYNTFKCAFVSNMGNGTLASANFIKGLDKVDGTYEMIHILQENFERYVQSIQLPNFTTVQGDAANTLAGSFQTHK